MYSLFCIPEGEYVKQYRYNLFTGKQLFDMHTNEVSYVGDYETKVSISHPPTFRTDHIMHEIIIFNTYIALCSFIDTWFSSRGFLAATNSFSSFSTNEVCANPESMLFLPFEAFEIHTKLKDGTVHIEACPVRSLYNGTKNMIRT